MTKACTKCGIVKPLDAFVRQASSRDGLKAQCRACSGEYFRSAYRQNPEKYIAKAAETYRANCESIKEKERQRRASKKQEIAEYQKMYRASHSERRSEYAKGYRKAFSERHAERWREWADANREKLAASSAQRKAAKLRATPAWANLDLVAVYYVMAAAFTRGSGVPHHVDHIEPLLGKHVCGLHNEFNLQVLPAKVNLSKGNRPSDVVGVR